MWTFPFRKGLNQAKKHNDQLALEVRGQRFLEKIASAPHKEPMGVTLMMLAWTAGPVTLLTVTAATWIGYGEPMDLERATYFLAYSVIAGLLGIITKVIYNTTHGRRESQDARVLLELVDRLPEIIYMVRDLRLANLGTDNRRIESAGILLRKFDLGPEWVACAIEDLTGNQELAKSAERIELYRRAGLYNRMNDLVQSISELASEHVNELRQTHPRIAAAMASRLKGQAPDIRQGQPRERLFLERILAAIDEDNEELITLPDVEHLLALCFELVCGRSITYLKVEYTGGDWNLTKAIDRLERCRNDYRLARARVYSRLRALAAYIDYVFPAEDNIASSQGLSMRVLMDAGIEGINRLTQDVNSCRRQVNTSGRNISELKMRLAQLVKALNLYRAVNDAWQKEGREGRRFNRALKVWQQRSRNWQQEGGLGLKRGLLISEQTVALDDEDKITVARELSRWLEENRIRRYSRGGKIEEKVLTITRARELAIEAVLILNPHIHLHDPEIQRAVDSSPLSTMAPLEPGMSPMTKAALGQAMANAIQVDLADMAEKLAQNLIRYYRVPLTAGTIDFLVDKYHASRSRLEFIAEHETPQSPGSINAGSTMTLPEVPRHWESTIYNARRTLDLLK
ncbi:hypothetical protein [Parendozoicomonas haliclonae]|uniref:Uncharacterized protein n=1 Tax=Parendozoicomonas haliclonae TaxID=1960125 RepID=A0A1X7AF35_9GAMM|nr:hypothetical protein [Parendozoicomonas haliclonae]SMA36296.1 hypothetical protein EHSB41UT_00620 [Parendozoicomonas haliclonae]